jgi:hypothetical protein
MKINVWTGKAGVTLLKLNQFWGVIKKDYACTVLFDMI